MSSHRNASVAAHASYMSGGATVFDCVSESSHARVSLAIPSDSHTRSNSSWLSDDNSCIKLGDAQAEAAYGKLLAPLLLDPEARYMD
eukprot:3392988-Pleurochrysis_carterae.AAC.1